MIQAIFQFPLIRAVVEKVVVAIGHEDVRNCLAHIGLAREIVIKGIGPILS